MVEVLRQYAAHGTPGSPAAAPSSTSPERLSLAVVEPASDAWDAFVFAHPHGNLLQMAAWGALKSAFGWGVQRIAVVGSTAGGAGAQHSPAHSPQSPPPTILAGAQLLWRQRYRLYVAYVPRGPLFAGDPAIDELLLGALQRAARHRPTVFLRLEPPYLEVTPESDLLHSRLLLHGFRTAAPIQPHSSIMVDLTPEPARLMAGFSKGHRADIRRAERLGLTVEVGQAADLGTFYTIMLATGVRANFAIHAEEYYQRAWELFQPRSRLLFALLEGRIVAAHMVFADGKAGRYLYGGALDEGLKTGANHLLQWHAMLWARAQGCSSYDLWGIPDAMGRAAIAQDEQERAALEAEAQSDPLIGVYRFKKGFGGQVARFLPAYDRVFLPPLYALWQRRFS